MWVSPNQTEYAHLEGGKYMFRIHRSPMCEYMINFIHKLKHLPEKYMMNSVLENFTILQVCGGNLTTDTKPYTVYKLALVHSVRLIIHINYYVDKMCERGKGLSLNRVEFPSASFKNDC